MPRSGRFFLSRGCGAAGSARRCQRRGRRFNPGQPLGTIPAGDRTAGVRREMGRANRPANFILGALAHQVERLLCTQKAVGSSPAGSTAVVRHHPQPLNLERLSLPWSNNGSRSGGWDVRSLASPIGRGAGLRYRRLGVRIPRRARSRPHRGGRLPPRAPRSTRPSRHSPPWILDSYRCHAATTVQDLGGQPSTAGDEPL